MWCGGVDGRDLRPKWKIKKVLFCCLLVDACGHKFVDFRFMVPCISNDNNE
jgi:hypothetical protein